MKEFIIPLSERALVAPHGVAFQATVAYVANRLLHHRLKPDAVRGVSHQKGGVQVVFRNIVIDDNAVYDLYDPTMDATPPEIATVDALTSVIGAFKTLGTKAFIDPPINLLLGDRLKQFFRHVPGAMP